MDISKLFNNRNLEEDNNFNELKKSSKKKSVKYSSSKKSDYKSASTEILIPEKHLLHFRKENRRGKVVTMVGFFQIQENEKIQLLKTLKKIVSTGGTVRDDYLEFQGDLKDRLKIELIKIGFKFK